jgi:histidine triad (HIT) family protein
MRGDGARRGLDASRSTDRLNATTTLRRARRVAAAVVPLLERRRLDLDVRGSRESPACESGHAGTAPHLEHRRPFVHAGDGEIASFADAEILIVDDLVFFAAGSPGEAQVLPGAGIVARSRIVKALRAHRRRWAATRVALHEAKRVLDLRLRPDGCNLIWNVAADAGQVVAHVHLHVIPRLHDEPLAGRRARWHLKQPSNRRIDPGAPGGGAAVS